MSPSTMKPVDITRRKSETSYSEYPLGEACGQSVLTNGDNSQKFSVAEEPKTWALIKFGGLSSYYKNKREWCRKFQYKKLNKMKTWHKKIPKNVNNSLI